ncbi:MAG: DUF2497 domain-containing protein [Alphaproteobacteria bacterium]|jgi:cell pole-organizing protein PopZ|nr:DUF2497 domain-containing protein [Alphaproteobacteria bacterium]
MANVSETLNKLSTLINSEMNLESEKIETTNSDDGDILSLNDVVDSTGDDLPNDTNEFNAADELNTVDDVNDDVTLESNENISKVETNSEKITSKSINHKDNLAVEPWQKAIKQELKEFSNIEDQKEVINKELTNLDLDEDFGLSYDSTKESNIMDDFEDSSEFESDDILDIESLDNILSEEKMADLEGFVKSSFIEDLNDDNEDNPSDRITSENEILVSSEVLSDSKAVIENLKNELANKAPSSNNIEDKYQFDLGAVIKPMIKEWLDKNLTKIVREIVEKEVKNITK